MTNSRLRGCARSKPNGSPGVTLTRQKIASAGLACGPEARKSDSSGRKLKCAGLDFFFLIFSATQESPAYLRRRAKLSGPVFLKLLITLMNMRPNDRTRGIFMQGWASTVSVTACICLLSLRRNLFFFFFFFSFSVPNPELLSKPRSALLVCSCCPFPPDWLLPEARKVCFHPKLQEKNRIIFGKKK